MHHFSYQDGQLFAEEVDLAAIAREVGTPFYCYSQATLLRHYRVFSEAVSPIKGQVFYALKANSNQSVIRLLGKEGAGADTVSAGEISRALGAGIAPNKIIFSGVGKRNDELQFALEQDIFQINVETRGELSRLSELAEALGKKAPIAFRVNPDVGSGGHEKITTGKRENKFGIELPLIGNLCQLAEQLPGIELKGLACHIGSQIVSLDPFERAMIRMRELLGSLRQEGHALPRLDLGGGLGVPYEMDQAPPLPMDYGAMLQRVFTGTEAEFAIEPGRLIVANAGILVSTVIDRQERSTKNFVVIDAAMNDLIRPTLYDAFHHIRPLAETGAGEEMVDIVGPICESGDYLAKDRRLGRLEPGAQIAIMSAGAYGAVMASTYNSRPLIPEVLVLGGEWAIVRPRESIEAQIARDHIAPWQA